MSEERLSVNFPAGHLISDAEVFYREKGCAFEDCRTENSDIAYLKMTFPAGTKIRPLEGSQGMEYRQILIFPDGTEVQEIQLRGRGSGPQYSQILRSEENQHIDIQEGEGHTFHS